MILYVQSQKIVSVVCSRFYQNVKRGAYCGINFFWNICWSKTWEKSEVAEKNVFQKPTKTGFFGNAFRESKLYYLNNFETLTQATQSKR